MRLHVSFLFIIIILLSNASIAVTCSTDTCASSDATTLDVSRHSLCVRVNNASGKSLMVPTKTSTELQTFINTGAITGVTRSACATAPTFVDIKSTSSSGATTCVVAKPTGLAVGDIMISLIYNSATLASLVPPSGFSAVSTYSDYSCGSSYRSSQHYKIADAADVAATNFTFTKTGAFGDCGLMLIAFRGVNTTTPIANTSQNINTGSGLVTWTTSTVTNGESLIFLMAEASSAANTPATYTAHGSLGSFGTRMASKSVSATGATGSVASTSNLSQWCATMIILNPL